MGADILLVAEHLEGKMAPATFELVAKGRELASQSGGVHQHQLEGAAGGREGRGQLAVEVLDGWVRAQQKGERVAQRAGAEGQA